MGRGCFFMQGSDDGEELYQEQRRDDVGQDGDVLMTV